MAQAFVAASRTVPEHLPPTTLSMHFIAGGDPAKDLEFQVVRLRDERRFANRRVDVTQDGVLLGTALVSHLAGGRGLEHNVPLPDVPHPATLPTIDDLLIGYEETVPLFVAALKPIQWRYTNDPAWVMRDKGDRLEHNRVWLTADGPMPDDPVLHAAALVYSSDTTVLDPIITRHGLSWGFRSDLRGDDEPHGVVPPAGAVRRVDAVRHIVAGGGRLAWPEQRPLLPRRRSDRGDGHAGRHHQVLPASLGRGRDRHSVVRLDLVAHVALTLQLGGPVVAGLLHAVHVVTDASWEKKPIQTGMNTSPSTIAKAPSTIPESASPPLVASPRLTRPPRAANPMISDQPEDDAARDGPGEQQSHDGQDQCGDTESVTRTDRWRAVAGVGLRGEAGG